MCIIANIELFVNQRKTPAKARVYVWRNPESK